MVAGGHVRYAVSYILHNARALMAQHTRWRLGNRAVHYRKVRVADTAVGNLHPHVAGSDIAQGDIVSQHQLVCRYCLQNRCEHCFPCLMGESADLRPPGVSARTVADTSLPREGGLSPLHRPLPSSHGP